MSRRSRSATNDARSAVLRTCPRRCVRQSVLRRQFSKCVVRSHSTSNINCVPVIHIPKSNIYHFGFSRNATPPVLQDVEWTVREGENWALVGMGAGGEKTALFQTLLGHLRISPHPPPPHGLFPFLASNNLDPQDHISLVSFGHRPRSSGGAFYDYTARYGAVREEDRVTLRQTMFPEMIKPDFKLGFDPTRGQDDSTTSAEIVADSDSNSNLERRALFDDLVHRLDLDPLLDLPLVALSNGQTRRARIVKALLAKPRLLLLDEPLTGLDVLARPTLLSLLHELHSTQTPRVIMGLRMHDPIPEWITHIALVGNGKLKTGTMKSMAAELHHHKSKDNGDVVSGTTAVEPGALVVDMKNVNVSYHERKVLKGINWEIRKGERWQLQGANGSGKTTLTSLLTGDHPQSYTNPHLHLFGRPRSRTATPVLASLIGLVSPELFNAFPRRANMSIRDTIGTGFDGGFVPLGDHRVGLGVGGALSAEEIRWRIGRVGEVMDALGPWSWGREPDSGGESIRDAWGKKAFVDLAPGEQGMVLLMRALVGRPPLVLLDEVWSGMDEGMIRAARGYLRSALTGEQAVVVISHWEDEVPWGVGDGVKRFRLVDGVGSVH